MLNYLHVHTSYLVIRLFVLLKTRNFGDYLPLTINAKEILVGKFILAS